MLLKGAVNVTSILALFESVNDVLRCRNFTITSNNFSAILILGSCLVVSRLHSNNAGVPGLLFRYLDAKRKNLG